MSTQVGTDIRALRKSRKQTLKQVADAIGRSTAWLSLVERGNTAASIHDLGLIAEVFGINISFFFRSSSREPNEQGVILRSDDRMPIGTPESGLVEELLSPRLDGQFEIIKSTFAPRSSSDSLKRGVLREDGGVVISGQLSLTLNDKTFDLQAGDSFQFSDQDYAWRNDSDEPAVVIWVISPPVY